MTSLRIVGSRPEVFFCEECYCHLALVKFDSAVIQYRYGISLVYQLVYQLVQVPSDVIGMPCIHLSTAFVLYGC